MPDLEKVIEGLKELRSHFHALAGIASSRQGRANHIESVRTIDDALALLTPRVLREGEVCDNSNRRTPMWLEMREAHGEDSCLWTFPISFNHWCDVMIFIPSTGEYRIELSVYKYGKEWRCWTSRPTYAQMEATAWKT